MGTNLMRYTHGIAMSLSIGRAVETKYVGNLERRPAHRPLPPRQARFRNQPALRS